APGVALLGGSGLDGYGLPAHVGSRVDRRPACLHNPLLAGLVVGDEVDATVLTLLGWRPARYAELVAQFVAVRLLAWRAGLELGDDVAEGHIVEGAGDAHHLADGQAEVDVPTLDGTGIGVDVLVRRVGGVGCDLERRLGLDRIGDFGRDTG